LKQGARKIFARDNASHAAVWDHRHALDPMSYEQPRYRAELRILTHRNHRSRNDGARSMIF
jgi:hypothetical protein